MFAIAFDLKVADTEQHHPKGAQQAYADIAKTLERFAFRRIQGSVYKLLPKYAGLCGQKP